ncbi:MAG: hypothetical protein ACE5HS_18090 [bacterium]
MPYLLVRHKVADFAKWKKIFDAHSEAQRQAGLKVEKVLRSQDDPNNVFLFFQVTDQEKARAFLSSSDVPEAQRQSGVLDTPDIYFLE